MNSCAFDRGRLRNLLILLLCASLVLYLPCVFHEIFADDEIYLAFSNRFLRESSWRDLYQLFVRPANPWEFLPVRDFTYWLDFRIYGDNPSGFHFTNLGWYVASTASAYWLFRELVLTCRPASSERATELALCGALLFVIHPAHVEAVAWIASRKDLLGGTFSLLSIAMLVRASRCGWAFGHVSSAAMLLLLACFGKASAITTFSFLFLFFAFRVRNPEIDATQKLAWFLVYLALALFVSAIHSEVGETSGIRVDNAPGFMAVAERASRILATLVGVLLFPYPLRLYYDVYASSDWHWVLSGCAIFCFLLSIFAMVRLRSLWASGVVLAFSSLIVYLQFVPFTTWSLASERFVFVAVAGIALVLIDILARIGDRRVIGVTMVLIVLLCAPVVWGRVAEWGESNKLLVLEYERQPEFHNAVRDQIVYQLLPERHYAEAEGLARRVVRAYARDALLALIQIEQVYRQIAEPNSTELLSGSQATQKQYCLHVKELRKTIHDGYEQVRLEPDVSYNNLLRSLERQLAYRYAGIGGLCDAS